MNTNESMTQESFDRHFPSEMPEKFWKAKGSHGMDSRIMDADGTALPYRFRIVRRFGSMLWEIYYGLFGDAGGPDDLGKIGEFLEEAGSLHVETGTYGVLRDHFAKLVIVDDGFWEPCKRFGAVRKVRGRFSYNMGNLCLYSSVYARDDRTSSEERLWSNITLETARKIVEEKERQWDAKDAAARMVAKRQAGLRGQWIHDTMNEAFLYGSLPRFVHTGPLERDAHKTRATALEHQLAQKDKCIRDLESELRKSCARPEGLTDLQVQDMSRDFLYQLMSAANIGGPTEDVIKLSNELAQAVAKRLRVVEA